MSGFWGVLCQQLVCYKTLENAHRVQRPQGTSTGRPKRLWQGTWENKEEKGFIFPTNLFQIVAGRGMTAFRSVIPKFCRCFGMAFLTVGHHQFSFVPYGTLKAHILLFFKVCPLLFHLCNCSVSGSYGVDGNRHFLPDTRPYFTLLVIVLVSFDFRIA